MSHTIIPVNIKPHLVPFLFKNLECVSWNYNGKDVKAAKVTNSTHLGRFIRLLLEKSTQKPECDKTLQNFLIVHDTPFQQAFMRSDFKYEDGRTGFLYLPKSGTKLINEYLEEDFETACMYYIHSRYKSNTDEGLDSIILDFFSKYNLEEFGFNTLRIRRDYYRKVKRGYFKATVYFDPVSKKITTLK